MEKLEREYDPARVVAGIVVYKDVATGLHVSDREAFEAWMSGDGK